MTNYKFNTRKLKLYVLDCIDVEDYCPEGSSGENDVLTTYAVFKSEYGHMIDLYRGGEKAAFASWLAGLPTVLTVDFSYHDIEQTYCNVLDGKKMTDKKREKFPDDGFNVATRAFFVMLLRAQKGYKKIVIG